MSRNICRSWPGMISALEASAGIEPTEDLSEGSSDDLDLVKRAARALERLRFGRGMQAADSVREALLEAGTGEPPAQTRALANLCWPLVLTTNYDDLYAAAVHQRALGTRLYSRERTSDHERRASPVQTLGRSSIDCHRVLCSLTYPAPPIVWALQGYLGGQATIRARDGGPTLLYRDWVLPYGTQDDIPQMNAEELQKQIIVGHADYRRVAIRSEGFRRAFAEVFRQRSFLFLGSGLNDRYLLDLFSQIIELYGPSAHPHFAIAVTGSLDTQFLRRNYGVWVHEMSAHTQLPEILNDLNSQHREGQRVNRYEYCVGPERHAEEGGRLNLATNPLSASPGSSSCVVLSGGGSGDRLRLSRSSIRYLVDSGVVHKGADHRAVAGLFKQVEGRQFIWSMPNSPAGTDAPLILAARVRLDPASPLGERIRPVSHGTQREKADLTVDARGRLWRDIRLTPFVMREVMEVAHSAGKSNVISTLLAAGGLRTIPSSYSLLEMIRAWGSSPLRNIMPMTIHVIDEVAVHDLSSGRLDVHRLLPTSDRGVTIRAIEFWLEIVQSDGTIDRVLILDEPWHPVRDLLEEYQITGSRWLLTVEPTPCLGWRGWTFNDIRRWESSVKDQPISLERIGVLHGSTIRVMESRPSSHE